MRSGGDLGGRSRLLLSNTLALLCARVIEAGAAIVTLAIIGRYLAEEAFGEYAYAIAIVQLCVPACLALEQITTRELARNRDAEGTYLGALMTSWLLLGVLALGLAGAAGLALRVNSTLLAAVLLAGLSDAAYAAGGVFTGVFRAHERMWFVTLTTLVARMTGLILVFLVWKRDAGFLYLFLALGTANTLRLILAAGVCWTGFVRPIFRFHRRLLKTLTRDAAILGGAVLAQIATFRGTVVVLTLLAGKDEAGLYHAAFIMVIQLQVISLAISAAVFPGLSRLVVTDRKTFAVVYEKGLKALLIIAVPLAVVPFSLSGAIVNLLFGGELSAVAQTLSLAIWAVIPLFLANFCGFTLLACDRQVVITRAWWLCVAISVGLTLALAPRHGAMGAVAGSLIAYVVLAVSLLGSLSREMKTLSLARVFPKPLAAGLAMALVMAHFKTASLLSMLGVACVGSVVYGLALLLLRTFTADERDLLKRTVMRKRKSQPAPEET